MKYQRSLIYIMLIFMFSNIFLLLRFAQYKGGNVGKGVNTRKKWIPYKNEIISRHTHDRYADILLERLQPHIRIASSSLIHDNIQNNALYSRVVKKEILTYPEFNITEPNFINEFGKLLFYAHPSNMGRIGIPSEEKLLGEIVIIRKGTFSLPHDCGYRSDVSFVMTNRDILPGYWFRSLMPMIVPDGGTFQHFLDGTLPKIIQSLHYIKQPQVKLLMPRIRDKIIYEILEKLNISRGKIITFTGSVGADYLVYTCVTPPLHPFLWQKARSLLGVPAKLTLPKSHANIVIITRTGCFNCGRRLLNEDALLTRLKRRYSNASVHMFKGPQTLNNTVALFGLTSVIIGVHGGGLYNINFCPSDTTVVEIMPTYSDGSYIAAAHQIFWTQSVLLGHQYWRLPTEPVTIKGDVIVNITLVEDIINKTWKV